MLEPCAQPIRFEISSAHLAVCRASDDRVGAGRPSRCVRAIDGADDVDKGNGFDALAVRVAAQGRDDFTLAQADGERVGPTEAESGIVSGWLEERGARVRVPIHEGVFRAGGHDAFAYSFGAT